MSPNSRSFFFPGLWRFDRRAEDVDRSVKLLEDMSERLRMRSMLEMDYDRASWTEDWITLRNNARASLDLDDDRVDDDEDVNNVVNLFVTHSHHGLIARLV